MKLLTRVIVTVLSVAILTAILLLTPIFGKPLLDLQQLVWNRNRTFSSREILEQVRDVLELQTVEYVYRMVFPHDFYPEGLSLRAVFDRLAAEQGPPAEILSPEEHAYLRAYNLAYETGLPTSSEGDSFVVVTVRVRGGYSAESVAGLQELFRLEPADPAARDGALPPEQSRVVVSLPKARIVDLVIEDLNQENYPYPPARVDAREWSAISSFVAEEARRKTVADGILEEAEENGRAFLTTLLLEAGFREIVFESAPGGG